MRNFAQNRRKEKIQIQKDWAERVLQKDQELRIVKEEIKRLRASHATLIKSGKTPSNSRDNSPAAQAVRPKANVQHQSRARNRDIARGNTQVSFRRSRRQTSFDASSSDNDGNSRGFLRRNNRTSSPQGAVRQDTNLDRIGNIPNSRNRNSNQDATAYLRGQPQTQFPTFADNQNFSQP